MIPSARKANWPSMLPSRGELTCTFSSTSVRKPLGVMESSKLTTLLKQLRLPSMSDRERLEMVAMFAPFALFSCKQISSVICTFSIGAERVAAATLLFTRAADAASDLVSLTSVMSGHDLLGWKDVLGWYSSYRWNVPTGGWFCSGLFWALQLQDGWLVKLHWMGPIAASKPLIYSSAPAAAGSRVSCMMCGIRSDLPLGSCGHWRQSDSAAQLLLTF